MRIWLLRLVGACGVLVLLFGVACLALTQTQRIVPWSEKLYWESTKAEWVLALVCILGGCAVWRLSVRELRDLAKERKQEK